MKSNSLSGLTHTICHLQFVKYIPKNRHMLGQACALKPFDTHGKINICTKVKLGKFFKIQSRDKVSILNSVSGKHRT